MQLLIKTRFGATSPTLMRELLVDLKFLETAYKKLKAGNLRSTSVKI
jgi:hypothetical protein